MTRIELSINVCILDAVLLVCVLYQIYVIDSADRKRFEETGVVSLVSSRNILLYTPCLIKNCANLSFAVCVSNINRFQSKIGRLSRNKPLIKLCLKCPLHLKYVLALPWEIQSIRLSRHRNN